MKKAIYILVSIFLLILFIISGMYIYTEIQQKNLSNLALKKIQQKPTRYATNSKTLNSLHSKKIKSIEIVSDNQGSGNVLYYTAEINHKIYGLTYVYKGNKLYLKSVKLISE